MSSCDSLAVLTGRYATSSAPTQPLPSRRGGGFVSRRRRGARAAQQPSTSTRSQGMRLGPSRVGRGGEVLPIRLSWTWWSPMKSSNNERDEKAGSKYDLGKKISSPEVTAYKIGALERSTSVITPSTHSTGELAAGRPDHRRRVTWSGEVEMREVERTPRDDVFSPDLLSLKIAQELASAANRPNLARAAQAIYNTRRQSAAAVRALTSRNGWSGSLDGMEDCGQALSRTECIMLREIDDIVRQVVSVRGRWVDGEEEIAEIWRLKEAYRAARRRMENADSD